MYFCIVSRMLLKDFAMYFIGFFIPGWAIAYGIGWGRGWSRAGRFFLACLCGVVACLLGKLYSTW